MKFKFLLICLIAFSSILVNAQNSNIDVLKIKKVLKEQESAWNKGKIKDYMFGYWNNDSLMFITKNGITNGWNKTFENYKEKYPTKDSMGVLRFDNVNVRLINDSEAFVIGKWTLSRKKDKVSGYFTLYFKKFGDEWKIIIDHTS